MGDQLGGNYHKLLFYIDIINKYGGAEGIRTLGTVTCPHAFQACAFDRSATAPRLGLTLGY